MKRTITIYNDLNEQKVVAHRLQDLRDSVMINDFLTKQNDKKIVFVFNVLKR